ncbi:MAG: molecular chaperone HtpG [Hyphomicrobiales bacterium]
MASKKAETKNEHVFEAEVAQLLKLMVHSVYSNKDIFLRELISNAADACEKLRYLAIDTPDLNKDDPDFKIVLALDEKENILTISDNGIGMSSDELISNLGTIARSGTKAFMESLSEKSDGSSLIGQFGVGFYSAFMVADKVEVYSCKAGTTETHVWTSDGEGTFTIDTVDMPKAKHGTMVRLHLSEDGKDYASIPKIEEIVRSYSSHVPVPIHITGKETVKGDDDKETEQSFDRILSDGGALWTKPKSEITEEEYKEFYGHVSGQFDDPASTIHYRAEGRHEYTVLAFLPSMKPFDLFNPDRKGRMKLYVRRVFISDDIDLLPPWLRFVRGIVDSEDLPLNISRELLQDNPLLEAIKMGVTKRILSEIKKLADKKPEDFENIWEAFGPVIKEGLYEDIARRDDIYEVIRFKSSTSDGKWRSLASYVENMKENQTAVYYALGDNEDAIKASPHLEGYRAREVEVLYLADPVDAFWVRTALGYQGKPFKSITQGSDDLETIKPANADDDKKDEETPELANLYLFLKETLGDDVSEVRASSRLAESPVCLVASEGAMDMQLQKILKDQPDAAMNPAPVLEVNASHTMIKKLATYVENEKDKDQAKQIATLLHGQARILDGEQPTDPAKFASALNHFYDAILA